MMDNLDVEAARWTQEQEQPVSYLLAWTVSSAVALVILAAWWWF